MPSLQKDGIFFYYGNRMHFANERALF